MSSANAKVLRWVPSTCRAFQPLPESPIGEFELSGNNLPSNPSFPFGDVPSLPSHNDEQQISTPTSVETDGVFLTWKDLWVFNNGEKKVQVPILAGLTGLALPSQVLAIMGPSGGGKSTLLDVLSGRLARNLRLTGEILLNGQKHTLAFGTSAYVTQEDVLMTTLTVREAVQYAAELQLPSAMSRAAKMQRAEETLLEMGLTGVAEVRIGGRMTKGISGGQRRRVSICVEIITRPRLLFLDEPTSGLDSAAAFHVMTRILRMAECEGMTVVAAVHQPSAEVFDLFGSVCLLAYGRTVFFGPQADAAEFFDSNGFPCPSLKNPSDHYLRTINKDFDSRIEGDPEANTLMTTANAIEILVKSYPSTMTFQQAMLQISNIHERGGRALKKRMQASLITQCLVLTRRSFINMYRDLGYYWLRFAIYVALCLCIGTVFYQVGHGFDSIQARGSMLMFVSGFLTFMAIGGFPSFVEEMKIFRRERLNGHYDIIAFTLANTLSASPYLALISIIPGAIAYYLVGLQSSMLCFLYFTLVLFACMMLVEGLMMTVASIVPDFLMGIITGAGIQGIMMLNGGFFRLPHNLSKPVWRYPMYYIAFHKYAFQGLYKNEFMRLVFPNNWAGGPPTITGEQILREMWQVEMGYSKWVDLAILFGMIAFYRILFLVILKAAEKVWPKMKGLVARDFMIISSSSP